MTSRKQLLRRASLCALAMGLTTSSVWAQANGSNFQVFSNGLDAAYAGIGAGGTQTALDGMGTWFHGEDLKGASMTVLGDWGYKHIGWRESACVLGPDPGPGGVIGGLAIAWPNIAFVELDGLNAHDVTGANVFTNPACVGPVPSFVPYGGSSAGAFVLAGYPSGVGLATSLNLLLPNNGLVPSSAGGTATLLANTGLAGLLIASTGFCWVVDFNWAPSAVVSLDDVDGWWHYMHNSPDLNQYWGMSNDEMNPWQSQSVVLDAGATALVQFVSVLDYEYHAKQIDPSTNSALQPAGSNGAGVYYAQTIDAGGGNPGVPGTGFDLGRHLAWSQSGLLGTINPATGLGAQDPAGSPLGAVLPTVGIATWNNEDYAGTSTPTGGWRLTWLTLDWDASFGIDPALAGEATKWFGQIRIPSTIPLTVPTPWPQLVTTTFFPFLVHNTVNHDGSGTWPDPNGFPSGTFGVPGVNGTTLHIPLVLGSTCIGVPIALQHGTTGLGGPGGPLVWNPGPSFALATFIGNAASTSAQLVYFN